MPLDPVPTPPPIVEPETTPRPSVEPAPPLNEENEPQPDTQPLPAPRGKEPVQVDKTPIPTQVPRAPFPHRLVKKKNPHYSQILDIFKNVQLNIPFTDAISHIPSYAKFLKDLITVKRKHSPPQEAIMTAQSSSLIQHNIVPKYQDPGCPTIPIKIGENIIENCLLDLGASVNLIPFSVYQQLGLGEL